MRLINLYLRRLTERNFNQFIYETNQFIYETNQFVFETNQFIFQTPDGKKL